MKQRLPLFILLLLSFFQLQAQTCVPDANVVDSSAFVLPIPFDSTTMEGGIKDTACINTYYETTFTFEIPSVLSLAGFMVRVDSLELDPDNPMSVSGLPEGMEYSCNRPNCRFISTEDSTGCALLFGTPTSNNEANRNYELGLTVRAYTAIGPQDIVFPNPDLPNADGVYSIYLAEEGSPSCSIVSTRDLIKESFSIQANPNPVSYYTQIQVEAQRDSELELMVFNVLGRQVYQRNIQVFEGTNSFEFDASQLPEGMYLYAITDGKNILTKKMMVNR